MQYEPMNEKQNNKFVLEKIYPQYFNAKKQRSPSPTLQLPTKIAKSYEDRKIQSKLKNIVYNLQRQVQEELFMNKRMLRNQSKNSSLSKATFKSYSHKSLKHKANSQRYHTEQQDAQTQQATQRSLIIQKYRKKQQLKRIKQQNQGLILPKLKLNNKHQQDKKRKYRLQQLNNKEHELGKKVLQKVQKHFAMQKMGNKHYYQRIKSQQGIDQSLVDFLKNKVNRANMSLNYNKL